MTQDNPPLSPRRLRRQRRAEALRRKALSVPRILAMVLALPVTTGLIAIGVYMRVTEYDRHDAVVHLVALMGCDASRRISTGPFRVGEPGYHPRNDPDGDGLACARPTPAGVAEVQVPKQRSVGTAKFLKP